MAIEKDTTTMALEDVKVNVKLKLAALWTSFMFLYIYVDYFGLYKPGFLEDIMAGVVWEFGITEAFLLVGLASVSIPALMVVLSVALPAKVNRWTNIIAAAVYIPYSLFNLAGEAWMFMIFGALVEVVLLSLVIWYAWKWPQADLAFLKALMDEGKMTPVIDRTYPMSETSQAMRHVGAGHARGKTAISMPALSVDAAAAS